MQLLVDFFPLLLFFVAFKWQGIYVATAWRSSPRSLQIAWIHWKHGRAGVTHWLSLAIIVVFGGATLLLQDKTFIKWKPTVLYGLFGAILAVGKLGFGRDLLAHLMKGVTLPAAVWSRLTWSWVAFFAFMGVANWYVAFHYSDRDLGQLQGLGRHRALPRVRAGARGLAGALRDRGDRVSRRPPERAVSSDGA